MNPIANTLVSDVRGPTDTLYLNGARLEEMQLIGMLPPGDLANITVFSYAGQLFFGLLAAETLPQLDRLGAYATDAFVELEAAVLQAHPRALARSEVRTVSASFERR
jgi:hypothetical protein